MSSLVSRIKKLLWGGALSVLLVLASTVCALLFNYNSTNVNASANVSTLSEDSIQPIVEGEIKSISIEINQSATNEYGVAGIFTSMTTQDLIDGEYLTLTVQYTSGESEEVTSGYTLSMDREYFLEGSVNNVTLNYNGFTTEFTVNATLVQLDTLEIDTANLLSVVFYETDPVNELSDYIVVTGVNNDGSPFSLDPIPFDETGVNGYTLQGPTSGLLSAGENNIGVNYQGVSGSFLVTTTEKTLEYIEAVFTQPDDTVIYSTHFVNDLSEYLTVYAYYNSSEEPEIMSSINYTITGDLFTSSEALDTPTVMRTCTVEVNGNEEITDTFQVEVTPDIPLSVMVSRTAAYNRVHTAQTTLNATGLTIMVNFQNAGLITVTSNYYVVYPQGDGRLHVGDESVKIGYRENGVGPDEDSLPIVPVSVEQTKVTRVSLPANNFTYALDEEGEAIVYELGILYYDTTKNMSIELAEGSAEGLIIDQRTGVMQASNAGVYIVNVLLGSDFAWDDGTENGSNAPITLQWEIRQASFTSSVSISSWYYGNQSINPVVTQNPGNIPNSEIVYYYYGQSADGVSFNYSREDLNTVKPSVVGTYYVYAYIPASDNYTAVTTTDALFYIRVGNNNINAENYSWGYEEDNSNRINPTFSTRFDLTTNYTISYYQGDNLLGSNTYSSTGQFQGENEYFPQNAGSYTVRIFVTGTTNYNDCSQDITLTITRKAITLDPTLNISNLTYQGNGATSIAQSKVLSNYDSSKMSFTYKTSTGTTFTNIDNDGAYFEISENQITFYSTHVVEGGGYVVTLTIGNNYTWADSSTEDKVFEWLIGQATNSVNITNKDEFTAGWTYTEEGLTFEPTYTATYFSSNEELVTYYLANGDELGANLGHNNPTDAGTYFVVVSVQETLDYTSASDRIKFTINKKQVTTPMLNHSSDEFSGAILTNQLTGFDSVAMAVLDESTTVDYSIDNSTINLTQTNAGSYIITIALATDNYIWQDNTTEAKSFNWIIEKASLTMPTLSTTSTYLGAEQSVNLLDFGVNSYMTITLLPTMQELGLVLSDFSLTAFDARTYSVNIGILDTDNYKWAGDLDSDEAETLTFNWTIDKATLNVVWSDTLSFEYTGRSIQPTYSVTGYLGTDESTGNYLLSLAGAQTNVGSSYEAIVSISRTDDGNINYVLSNNSTNFSITKASLYVTWTNTSLTYNGQNQTPSYTVDGFKISTEQLLYEFSFSQSGLNVGNYSTELNIARSDLGVVNYELKNSGSENAGATTEFSISPATLTVNWGNLEFTYDGTAKLPSPTFSGWFNEDETLYNITVTPVGGEKINAGSYTTSLSLALIDENEENVINYTFSDSEENFTILKARVNIGEIVHEPSDIEGNQNANDRAIPHTGYSIELNIDSSPLTIDGTNVYQFATNKYLNSSKNPIQLADAVSPNTYYIVLELTDPDNYEWYNRFTNDEIVDNGKTIQLWYRITRNQFDMSLTINDLSENINITYGETYTYNFNNPGSADVTIQYYQVNNTIETLMPSQPVDVGEYKFVVTIAESELYDSMTAELSFSITKRVVGVTIEVSDGTYGDWEPAYILDSITNLAGEGYSQITASDFVLTYTSTDDLGYSSTVAPVLVGQYRVEASLENLNYTIDETFVNFEINRANLDITIKSETISYADSDPTQEYLANADYIEYDTADLKNGDTILNLGITFAYATNYEIGDPANGDYYIYLSSYPLDTANLDNYVLNITRGKLTVNPKTISAQIDLNTLTFEYDADNIYIGDKVGATATPSGLYNEDTIDLVYTYQSVDATTYPSSEVAPVNAGTYQVIVTTTSNNYYLNQIATFTISRAKLDITINDISITYGDADPTTSLNSASNITYDVGQLKGQDQIEDVISLVFSTNYVQGNNAGDYKIYLATYGEEDTVVCDVTNYTLNIIAGNLNVGKKTITATINIDGERFEYDGNNMYISDVVGATATAVGAYQNENVEFSYLYSGLQDTVYNESAIAPINAGTYQVIVSLTQNSVSANNYIFENATAIFEIYKKQVDVIWESAEQFVYNGENQISGIIARYVVATDDSQHNGLLSISIIEGESSFVNAGSYVLQAELATDLEKQNYELVNNITKNYTIEKATISAIEWHHTALGEFTYNGEVLSNVVFATFTGAETDGREHDLIIDTIKVDNADQIFRDANDYVITVKLSETDDRNYQFAESVILSNNYTIENADISINGEVVGYTGIYDATEHNVANTLPTLIYVESAGSPVWKYRIKADTPSEYAENLTIMHAGEYTIEYEISLNNHNSAYGEFVVNISKKDLQLTASISVQFGNDIPQDVNEYLIQDVAGYEFAGDENYEVLNSETVVFSTPDYVAGTSGVDQQYTLILSGFQSNDYNISYVAGTITVLKRSIQVTISSVTRTYGEGLLELPANSYSSITLNGLEGVLPSDIYTLSVYDDEGLVSLSENLNVGNYDIVPVVTNNNYEISEVVNGQGAYIITARPISISFTGLSYIYDGQTHEASARVSTSGLENLELRVLYDGSQNAPWEAGTYVVSAQIIDQDSAGNYEISAEAIAELTIHPRAITIRINDQTAPYDGSLPQVSSEMGVAWEITSVDGLCNNVNGELDNLNVVLSIPEDSINAGRYVISGVYDNDNYNVTSWGDEAGEFIITKLELSATIENQELTYGEDYREFVIVYDGFILGEDENTNNMFTGGTPSAQTDYQAGNDIGEYDINFVTENISSTNYNITFVGGKIYVSERNITVRVLQQSSDYTGNKPEVSSVEDIGWEVVSEIGIYGSDQLNISLDIEESSVYNAGNYDIICSYNNENYIITWEENSNIDAFTINKVELTVKANDVTIAYGNNPVNSYTISGFVNNENESVIQGLQNLQFANVGYSTTIGAGSTGSVELIGVDSLTSTNYTFVADSGTWNVIKRSIDLEVDSSRFYNNQTNVYGEYAIETPINSAKVQVVESGLVNDDTTGDSGDVDVLFVYTYYGTSNDGLWNYPLEGDGSLTHPTLAGSYTVIVTILSDNYRINNIDEEFELDYIILKHRVITPAWENSSFNATGEEHTNTLIYNTAYSRVLTSSSTFTDDGNGRITMTASDGGEYSVTLTLLDEYNHVWTTSTGSSVGDNPSVVITWTISRNTDNEFVEEISISIDGEPVSIISRDEKLWFDHTWIYEDVIPMPTASAKYGMVEFDFYYSNGERVGEIPSNAGEYYVIAYVTGTLDWNSIESEPVYFSISRKVLDIPTISNDTYSGNLIKKLVNNYLPNVMTTLGSNVEIVFESNNLYLQATNIQSAGYYVNIALQDAQNYVWSDGTNSTKRLSWMIELLKINKPNLVSQTYEYDGEVKQISIDASDYYSITNNSAINAGNYTLTVRLNDKNNYIWSDNSNEDITLLWYITPRELSLPIISPKTYNHGNVVTSEIENYDSDLLRIENLGSAYITSSNQDGVLTYYLNAINSGTYTIKFSLRDVNNYEFVSPFNETDSVEVSFVISKYVVSAPTYQTEQSYAYTGEEIQYSIQHSVDEDYYIVNGNVGLNVDEYNVTISLIDPQNYMWRTQETEALTDSWNIIPATDNEVTIENENVLSLGWVYGDSAITPIVSDVYNGEISVEYYLIAENEDELLQSSPTNAGNYYVVITSTSANGNFNTDSATIYFTIDKAELTITPNNITITYGDDLPNVSYQVSGLIGSDRIEDLGSLIIICNYDKTNAELRNVGTYEITLSGLSSNNYTINYNKANLVVAKKDITVTLLDQSSEYNGLEPVINQSEYSLNENLVYVDDELDLQIVKTAGVNAGSYELSAVANNENYNVNVINAEFIIEKATIYADEITFADATYLADGNVYSIVLQGLPTGFAVEYDNNYVSQPGIYVVIARLVYDDDNYNYLGNTEFSATLTLNKPELTVQDDYRIDSVILSSQQGFSPNANLSVATIDEEDYVNYDLSNYENTSIAFAYNIELTGEDVSSNMNLSLLIPTALANDDFTLLVNKNGVLTEVDYERLGSYAVFSTDSLGDFLFVTSSVEETNMVWLIVVLSVILLALIVWFIFTLIKTINIHKNRSEDQKTDNVKINSLIPLPMLLALTIPKSHLISIIVISVVCVLLLITNIILSVKNKKIKNQAKQPSVDLNANNETEIIDEDNSENNEELSIETFKTDEDNNNKSTNFDKLKVRSFRSKLRMCDADTKEKYKEIMQYVKSLPDVKTAIGKKQLRVYKGRKTLANIFFRGKTICIAYSLNPANYENTKYKGLDVSEIKRFASTPMLIRLTSKRKVMVAKHLFSECL